MTTRAAPARAARMRTCAEQLLDALDPDQRRAATAPFDTPDHRDWTYLPGERPGLALGDLDDRQRLLVHALLDSGLSVGGAAVARDVMALDDVLGELERSRGAAGWRRRGSDLYWVRVLGTPDATRPWGWRLNGHHLAVHLTVVGDAVAGAPQFFGANPAVVRTGPRAGWQVLAPEESHARRLLAALPDEHRAAALVSADAPSDILTRHDPLADPARVPRGVTYERLGPEVRPLVEALLRVYVERLAPEVAEAMWAELVEAGLDHVGFAWAGGTEPGEPHYYALTGPTFLAEYDNVQDGANHVHTVWRDLRHDWGRDLLAEHYRTSPH